MTSEAAVRAIALSLPGTTEEQWYQTPGYKVAGKGFLRPRTEAEGGLVVFVSDMGRVPADGVSSAPCAPRRSNTRRSTRCLPPSPPITPSRTAGRVRS